MGTTSMVIPHLQGSLYPVASMCSFCCSAESHPLLPPSAKDSPLTKALLLIGRETQKEGTSLSDAK